MTSNEKKAVPAAGKTGKMTVGMVVILIVVVQFLIVLLVIKPFFPNALGQYKTVDEKAGRVIENLTTNK
jgi:ABC-type cobalt transport system substrate-binding protein